MILSEDGGGKSRRRSAYLRGEEGSKKGKGVKDRETKEEEEAR